MLFNSPVYIFLFLPISVAVHFMLAHWVTYKAAKVWLIIASVAFYCYSAMGTLPVLLCSIGLNYFIGAQLHRTELRTHRQLLLCGGVVLNLSLLGYFKYTNFFIHNLNLLTGTEIKFASLGLPLAISFYTFQQIAFLADCYNKKETESSFLSYCLFVLFFPQLIAGPIVRHRELVPQFFSKQSRWFSGENTAAGVFVFGIGLFKKLIIGDSFAVWANAGFYNIANLSFFEAWTTTLSYTFQLYYDFSGYTDMAIGAALMFNIRLPINFNSPYKALSITDFWRRWHISLSRWLRDYVYIPLGGNRKGSARTVENLFITFLLGGIWHGAGWTFVVWGMLHGAALAAHRIWQKTGLCLPRIVAWLSTFLFINTSWVFFRAESVEDAVTVLKAMLPYNIEPPVLLAHIGQFNDSMTYVERWAVDGPILTVAHSFLFIVAFPLITFLMPNSMQLIRVEEYDGPFAFKTTLAMALVLAVLVFTCCLSFVGNVSSNTFLYFNF